MFNLVAVVGFELVEHRQVVKCVHLSEVVKLVKWSGEASEVVKLVAASEVVKLCSNLVK